MCLDLQNDTRQKWIYNGERTIFVKQSDLLYPIAINHTTAESTVE